jgi:hypothetical protein
VNTAIQNSVPAKRLKRACLPIILATLALAANAGTVTVTANVPTYNFQVLPGSTRQINVNITGGTLNTVNWSVLSTTGGASATFTTPAGSGVSTVSAGLATVQVNIGPTAGNCSIPEAQTAIGTYTVTSTATVTVQAQSVDDTTKSATVLFNVCAKTTTVMVAPAYQQAFKSQHRMLQSWISGDSDETGTWSVVSQPSGGDGTLADTTNRDADFVATVTGRYTLEYTSHSNPSKSATAIVYVSPNALPSYASTPNYTEPRECYVDPALTGGDYEVGAGKAYTTIQSTPAANTLAPGSIIRVWNTDTTGSNPSTYHEYYQIHNSGTATQPMILCGVPDAHGNLPVVDGANATGQSGTSTGGASGYGIISLWSGGYNGGGPYGFWQAGSGGPSHVVVTGLHLVHATPAYTYTPPGGGTATAYVDGASCLNLRSGSYIDLGGNDIDTCTNGLFTAENANGAWAPITQLVTVTGNHIHQSGYLTDGSEHQLYFQTYYGLLQGNLIDNYVSTAQGSSVKWRGVEGIFRYNDLASGPLRDFDLVENQDGPAYVTFEDYLSTPGQTDCYASLYCTGDTAGPNIIAGYQESAQKDFIYGNLIFGTSAEAQIHYAEDNVGGMSDRNGTLYFFSNTLDNAQMIFDTGEWGDGMNPILTQRVDARNNILWARTPAWSGVIQMVFGHYASIILSATTNLMLSGTFTIAIPIEGDVWQNGTAEGWSSTCDGTCLWPLTVPLNTHLYGLSNANYLTSSTLPYNATTLVPVAGSAAIEAGTALSGMLATMPVRWQYSIATHSLTPRLDPLTIGAEDGPAVGASSTTQAANASAVYSPSSQPVNLTATVTSNSAPVTGGTVAFTVAGLGSASASVSAGQATATFQIPAGSQAGTYSISASYSGNGSVAASTGGATLSIAKANPVLTWSNPADIVFGGGLGVGQLNASANVPGTLVYAPPAGTVLPIGTNESLQVTFTPTDTTDYATAVKTVTINVTQTPPAPGAAIDLIITPLLARDPATNDVIVYVTAANNSASSATNAQVTAVSIGTTTAATPLPVALGTIVAGGTATAKVQLAGPVGASGTRAALTVRGTYTGGQFTLGERVILP